MKKIKIEILFEDDHIVVINKPPRILSIGDSYNTGRQNVMEVLMLTREELFLVHRLDIETSGAMVFAKTADALSDLTMQFENNKVTKKYLTFITGYPEKEGVINEPIAESMTSNGRMVINKRGKDAITEYKVLQSYRNNISFVEVNLLTGRRHQIRVHMANNGTPLLVDIDYKGREAVYIYDIKKKVNKLKEDQKPLIDRVSLHASILSFDHPKTNEKVDFKADFPKDMRALHNQLEKTLKK